MLGIWLPLPLNVRLLKPTYREFVLNADTSCKIGARWCQLDDTQNASNMAKVTTNSTVCQNGESVKRMPFFLKNSSGQILIKGLLLTFYGNMPATRATNLFTGVDLVNYPGQKYNVEQIIYLIKQIQSTRVRRLMLLKY